jgi:prepilin-type N-terminal cleavage/methylation domain-containing protein
MDRKNKGFTLIELMIVVVIIGILAAMAIPRFMRAATKAKQSEAKGILKQVYTMQRCYFIENDHYCRNGIVADASNLTAFAPLAVELISTARYAYTMTVNGTTFICTATANLDDDATIDTWSIDQTGALTCVTNDATD